MTRMLGGGSDSRGARNRRRSRMRAIQVLAELTNSQRILNARQSNSAIRRDAQHSWASTAGTRFRFTRQREPSDDEVARANAFMTERSALAEALSAMMNRVRRTRDEVVRDLVQTQRIQSAEAADESDLDEEELGETDMSEVVTQLTDTRVPTEVTVESIFAIARGVLSEAEGVPEKEKQLRKGQRQVTTTHTPKVTGRVARSIASRVRMPRMASVANIEWHVHTADQSQVYKEPDASVGHLVELDDANTGDRTTFSDVNGTYSCTFENKGDSALVVCDEGGDVKTTTLQPGEAAVAITHSGSLEASLIDFEADASAVGVTQTGRRLQASGGSDAIAVMEVQQTSVQGDPHLHFAHGGTADFRGRNDVWYVVHSSPGLQFAAMTREASFLLPGAQLVHGSFFTRAAFTLRGKNNALYAVSVDADEVGFRVVDKSGQIVGKAESAWRGWKADGYALSTKQSSTILSTPEWEILLTRKPVYNALPNAPEWRFDIAIRCLVGEAELTCFPHGLIGQSFDGDQVAVDGKRDPYDGLVVETAAMAEGAIEGDAEDYELFSPHETLSFQHSRFLKRNDDRCAPRDAARLTGHKRRRHASAQAAGSVDE